MTWHLTVATALLLGLMVGGHANAQIYQCKVDGRTRFQDKPCATEATMKVLATPSGAGAQRCYQVIQRDGGQFQAEDLWTSKQQGESKFYLREEGQSTTLVSQVIAAIELDTRRDNCASGVLEKTDKQRTRVMLCNVVNLLTADGTKKLAPTDIVSITPYGG